MLFIVIHLTSLVKSSSTKFMNVIEFFGQLSSLKFIPQRWCFRWHVLTAVQQVTVSMQNHMFKERNEAAGLPATQERPGPVCLTQKHYLTGKTLLSQFLMVGGVFLTKLAFHLRASYFTWREMTHRNSETKENWQIFLNSFAYYSHN